MILTDFATAIGVATFMLLALKWLREPSKHYLALWAGGALGLNDYASDACTHAGTCVDLLFVDPPATTLGICCNWYGLTYLGDAGCHNTVGFRNR